MFRRPRANTVTRYEISLVGLVAAMGALTAVLRSPAASNRCPRAGARGTCSVQISSPMLTSSRRPWRCLLPHSALDRPCGGESASPRSPPHPARCDESSGVAFAPNAAPDLVLQPIEELGQRRAHLRRKVPVAAEAGGDLAGGALALRGIPGNPMLEDVARSIVHPQARTRWSAGGSRSARAPGSNVMAAGYRLVAVGKALDREHLRALLAVDLTSDHLGAVAALCGASGQAAHTGISRGVAGASRRRRLRRGPVSAAPCRCRGRPLARLAGAGPAGS
jgi:hypothetical protein